MKSVGVLVLGLALLGSTAAFAADPEAAPPAGATKVPFAQVFDLSEDGKTITPKMPVRIGGATLSPSASIGRGGEIGGVDLFKLVGRTLFVDREGGTLIYKGYE